MAGAHTKHHDYHLVDPSPWPLVGAASATIMAIGAVMWMKALPIGGMHLGPLVFGAGLLGVLYTMLAWWMDVIREAEKEGHHTRVVQIHHRYGMIMFIASEVMFFVAWFWIFFEMALFHGHRTLSSIEEVRAAWATWPPAGIETVPAWNLPLLNTLILLLSGTTVTWAHHALQQGDRKGTKIGLALTIALGAIFTMVQVYEYHHILEHKYFFGGEGAEILGTPDLTRGQFRYATDAEGVTLQIWHGTDGRGPMREAARTPSRPKG